ncbi:MAG TPA: glycosyltransferase family 4 protein [Sphingomonadaceae bacterium]
MQYVPLLAEAGIEVDIAPFFGNDYLERLYAGRSTAASVGRGFACRIGQLRRITEYDVVWLEKEALPWLPWRIERALLDRGVPIVSDYDDAVFHRYDLHRSRLVRHFLGSKIDRVMGASALVIAGNDYLADRARTAGAPKVEIVPTVVDTNTYGVAPAVMRARNSKIGWIGTPSTWTEYVGPLLPTLLAAAEAAQTTLYAVGARPAAAPCPNLELVDWSEDREVDLIQGMAIGIMPLDDSPWARGKCGYKLIQYMACGLPVVASPTGVNSEIVEHGVNGFLASSEDEWREALAKLLNSAELRRKMGDAGRLKVERQYSLQACAPKIAELLRQAASGTLPKKR